jgi:hypothetical protein
VNENYVMKTPFAIAFIPRGVMLRAWSGWSFPTPGQRINFPGKPRAAADNHSLPPAVDASLRVAGIGLLTGKSKHT